MHPIFKDKKTVLLMLTTIIMAGFATATFFYKKNQKEELAEIQNSNADAFERPHSPSLGPRNAPVTLVEFLDPECESCRAFYPYVKKIMKDFEGDIRLVIRYVPFHKNSRVAIAVLEASRKQNKYWEVMETLFDKQPEWGNHHNPRPELIPTYLPALGIDMQKLQVDSGDPNIPRIIETDFSDAKKLEVRGTPTFFVNQIRLTDFSYQGLLNLIRSEMMKARSN